jgi:hypothetical protein
VRGDEQAVPPEFSGRETTKCAPEFEPGDHLAREPVLSETDLLLHKSNRIDLIESKRIAQLANQRLVLAEGNFDLSCSDLLLTE